MLNNKSRTWVKVHRQPSHLVVHLLGAVEDVDHDTQGSAKILSGLSLTGSCWAGRSTAHH